MTMPLAGAPADPASSHRAIENLIATYAELVDDGDFAGVGHLLADATFIGRNVPVTGRDAIEAMLRDSMIVYEDGTPRTEHLVTNIIVEVDEETGAAAARSYVTALQALPDLPLQPIVSGGYHDRFERRDGRWRFVERRVHIDLVGELPPPAYRSRGDHAAVGHGAEPPSGQGGSRVPDYPNAACEALKKSVGSYSAFTARNLARLDP
jgi:3-phenylpropionate/cinnamic acid dioxygenase small subunit